MNLGLHEIRRLLKVWKTLSISRTTLLDEVNSVSVFIQPSRFRLILRSRQKRVDCQLRSQKCGQPNVQWKTLNSCNSCTCFYTHFAVPLANNRHTTSSPSPPLLWLNAYTGCCRRNLPYLGRMFLRLIYICLTKHIWSEIERLGRELSSCGFAYCTHFNMECYPYTAHVRALSR